MKHERHGEACTMPLKDMETNKNIMCRIHYVNIWEQLKMTIIINSSMR